jgi:DDE superfamily endonuclease
MARPCMTAVMKAWINQLACLLDARVAFRLLPLLTGLLFATGRRTVSSWLRAGGLSKDYQDYYYFLSIVGRKVELLAGSLLRIVATVVPPGERVLLAIDDTPSKRYGPKVEGAGVHHNPTPGPAGSKFIYGHNWVTLAWIVRHPLWGAIGLPVLAQMYVRRKDIVAQQLKSLRGVTFQTKLVMAGDMVSWAARVLQFLGREGVGGGRWSLRQADVLEGSSGGAGHRGEPIA